MLIHRLLQIPNIVTQSGSEESRGHSAALSVDDPRSFTSLRSALDDIRIKNNKLTNL